MDRYFESGAQKAVIEYIKRKTTLPDNLLIALQRYAQRPNYNPLENFVTEVFAWLLRNNRQAEKAFLVLIRKKCRSPHRERLDRATEPGHWTSQRLLSKENGIVDLLGIFEDFVLVIEIKISADGENNQLSRYVKEIKKEFPLKRVFGVYLTQYSRQFKGKQSSCKILWEDVYNSFEKINEKIDEKEGAVTVKTFIELLKYRQICAVPPIALPEWRYPCGTYETQTFAEKCFWDLVQDTKPDELLPAELLKDFSYLHYHHYWGRLGFLFCRKEKQSYENWNPQIFIGLLIDLDNWHIGKLFNDQIPFAMVIDIGHKYWKEIYTTKEWINFSNKLKEKLSNTSWNLYEITNEKGFMSDRWNPLVIFRSMVDIVNDPKLNIHRSISSKTPDYLSTLVISKTKELLEILAEMEEFEQLVQYFDEHPLE